MKRAMWSYQHQSSTEPLNQKHVPLRKGTRGNVNGSSAKIKTKIGNRQQKIHFFTGFPSMNEAREDLGVAKEKGRTKRGTGTSLWVRGTVKVRGRQPIPTFSGRRRDWHRDDICLGTVASHVSRLKAAPMPPATFTVSTRVRVFCGTGDLKGRQDCFWGYPNGTQISCLKLPNASGYIPEGGGLGPGQDQKKQKELLFDGGRIFRFQTGPQMARQTMKGPVRQYFRCG